MIWKWWNYSYSHSLHVVHKFQSEFRIVSIKCNRTINEKTRLTKLTFVFEIIQWIDWNPWIHVTAVMQKFKPVIKTHVRSSVKDGTLCRLQRGVGSIVEQVASGTSIRFYKESSFNGHPPRLVKAMVQQPKFIRYNTTGINHMLLFHNLTLLTYL